MLTIFLVHVPIFVYWSFTVDWYWLKRHGWGNQCQNIKRFIAIILFLLKQLLKKKREKSNHWRYSRGRKRERSGGGRIWLAAGQSTRAGRGWGGVVRLLPPLSPLNLGGESYRSISLVVISSWHLIGRRREGESAQLLLLQLPRDLRATAAHTNSNCAALIPPCYFSNPPPTPVFTMFGEILLDWGL